MIIKFNQFVNENSSFPKGMTIEEFVDNLRLPLEEKDVIIEWWNKNRKRFNILYFKFNTTEPINGVFIDENTVAVNSKIANQIPAEILLYIILHETRHADQEINDKFSDRYFNTVLNDQKEEFLKGYSELEKDANDYAIKSMIEMGFDNFVNYMERMMRGNEREGENVWRMMRADIEKFQAKSFSELLTKQILK